MMDYPAGNDEPEPHDNVEAFAAFQGRVTPALCAAKRPLVEAQAERHAKRLELSAAVSHAKTANSNSVSASVKNAPHLGSAVPVPGPTPGSPEFSGFGY